MKKIIAILFLFFTPNFAFSQSLDSLLLGDWILNARFLLSCEREYDFKSCFTHRYYIENIFYAPSITTSYYKFDSLDAQQVDIIYKFHKKPSEYRNTSAVDSSNLYIHQVKLFSKIKWKLTGSDDSLQVQFDDKKENRLNRDVLYLDNKSLFLAFNDQKEKILSMYFYLKAGIDNRNFFKNKDKYFLIPYIEKYLLRQNIPVKIKDNSK